MELLIVRHGPAVERGTPGYEDDDRRPLTEEGEKKFRKAARGLARLLPKPDVLLTSPLPRAHRTAEIAAEAWGGAGLAVAPPLAGGSLKEVAGLIAAHRTASLVALFGHEPDVSELLAHLLGTSQADRVAFKKGGAALVELDGGLEAGGRLVWFLPPRVLRELGD
jgi:phosphohistidine phosphatase